MLSVAVLLNHQDMYLFSLSLESMLPCYFVYGILSRYDSSLVSYTFSNTTKVTVFLSYLQIFILGFHSHPSLIDDDDDIDTFSCCDCSPTIEVVVDVVVLCSLLPFVV
mmetsp:Transcript_7709/g.10015  ORF Transcript_7709/g.10015 Transcript_7709/m.10015 type:complete len:108 (+) Transcript_7709:119-442(+)